MEEQFYLLWPLIVVGLARRGGAACVARWSAVGALCSAGLMALLYNVGVGESRLYYGTDTRAQALLVGAAAMALSFTIGVLYGAIAGFAGGFVDSLMMRFVDAMLSFPTFFLLLIISALTNHFSLSIIIVIIGLTAWPGLARLVRAEVLSLRDRDFVEAARALGASPARLVTRHLIPNALAPVVVAAAFAIGDNILAESSLSFFGLGVQPPQASWGNMLQDALTPQAEAAPWMVLVPGLAIVATVLAFSLIADGIRVALDTSIGQQGAAETLEVEPPPSVMPSAARSA